MKDYWSELNLPETWSKKERFNYIMNRIDSINPDSGDDSDPVIPDDDYIEVASVSVSVTDSDDNGIKGAVVTLSKNNKSYTGTTGSAGGCTIRNVPLGDYDVVTEAENYVTDVDSFRIVSGENILEITLLDDE